MAKILSTKQSLKTRLGSDLKFPIAGNFESISGLDLLMQDIQILLLTLPGERVQRPTFGCNLRNMIWENMAQDILTGLPGHILESGGMY